jgi:hypothetical protein
MKHRIGFSGLLLLALFLAQAPTALASTKWYVDGVHGRDKNNCKSRQHACKTIGHAISLASSGDTIRVGPATYIENLTISISLSIVGHDAATTIIDGGRANSVLTNHGGTLKLSNLTIQNGRAMAGGGISGEHLIIRRCIITRNVAQTQNMHGANGGGIYVRGSLTISNSTVSANETFPIGLGAAIYIPPNTVGVLTINNSTISANVRGPAIRDDGGPNSSLYVNNSTLDNPIGLSNQTSTPVILQNTIVAGGKVGGGRNCSGAGIGSNGYNLSSDNTCNFNNIGDLNNTDPKLGPLQSNGGPTPTQALLSGSPAIDAGNPNGCTDNNGHLLNTDQRGKPRPDKEDTGGCDMGAYERQKD